MMLPFLVALMRAIDVELTILFTAEMEDTYRFRYKDELSTLMELINNDGKRTKNWWINGLVIALHITLRNRFYLKLHLQIEGIKLITKYDDEKI